MNWGRGLALALIIFAGMMAWFVVMASRNPEHLVSETYYADELLFQERIAATERAHALSAPVRIHVGRDAVLLQFPPEVQADVVTGTLSLQCPNDPRYDRELSVQADTLGAFSAVIPAIPAGRYNARLTWAAAGRTYYSEDHLVVP